MRYRYCTADVFTTRRFGGNPLAVFPDGHGLDAAQMQIIAREFNLSETVFVLPPDDPAHTRRLRIFTPGRELSFAGHPTVGAAHVLAAVGEIALTGSPTRVVFEEGVGPVKVDITVRDGQPVFAQLSSAKLPEFGPNPPPTEDLAAMLSLQPGDLMENPFVPQAASCGTPFLFVPVRDRSALKRARLDLGRWESVLASFWAPQVFLFTFDAELEGSDLRARMFSPAMGIPEDPATGSAAAAIAGYLGVRNRKTSASLRWVIEQGFEMGRPSILEVEADKVDGQIAAVRVGGASVLVSEGTMETFSGNETS